MKGWRGEIKNRSDFIVNMYEMIKNKKIQNSKSRQFGPNMNETKRVDAEERETMANWSSFRKILTG